MQPLTSLVDSARLSAESYLDEVESACLAASAGSEDALRETKCFRQQLQTISDDDVPCAFAQFQDLMAASGVALAIELAAHEARESFADSLAGFIERLDQLRPLVGRGFPVGPSMYYVLEDMCRCQRRWAEDVTTVCQRRHEFLRRRDELMALVRLTDPPGTRHVGLTRDAIRTTCKRAMIDHVAYLAARLREPSNLTRLCAEHREEAAREADRILALVDDIDTSHGLRRFVPTAAQRNTGPRRIVSQVNDSDDDDILDEKSRRLMGIGDACAGRNDDELLSASADERRLREWATADEEFAETIKQLLEDVRYSATRAFNLGTVVRQRNRVEAMLDRLDRLLALRSDVTQAMATASVIELQAVCAAAKRWLRDNQSVTYASLRTLESELRTCIADAGLFAVDSIQEVLADERADDRGGSLEVLDVAAILSQELHNVRAAASACLRSRESVGHLVQSFDNFVTQQELTASVSVGALLDRYKSLLHQAQELGVHVPASCWTRIPSTAA
jgi:hypothetical protein